MNALLGFLAFAVGTVLVALIPVVAVWLIMQVLKVLGFVVRGGTRLVGGTARHLTRFVGGEIVDSLQLVGSLLTAGVVTPLALGNLALFRLRSAKHYGTAAEDEIMNAFACLYRIGIGHPIRLVGLGVLTDGLERRLPDLVESEPRTGSTSWTGSARRRRVRARTGGMSRGEALRRGERPTFHGYELLDELQPGGSGARLFSAIPTNERSDALKARGVHVPSKVVIKAFALGYGSTIPQIVRESRSLDAAKSLGLVLEHALDDDTFHYVMPFVPGRDLGETTREMHAASRSDGLDKDGVRRALGYARDLCDHLSRFHAEGLWHKDIKPSNLMVADGRLQVVDFGLLTPLESALTLTTHGTEFFRDPELVRLALAGKRVKDVDGVKFDVYSAGAVLYSMFENSFPAHGSLSSISKETPEALRWIVRRAMADIDKRYASAEEFGRDIDVVLAAHDPYAVKPAHLPSVRGEEAPAPRAMRASHSADEPKRAVPLFPHDASRDPSSDTKRFEAFGLKAEVQGLGRMRSAMKQARDQHHAQRRARRAAKHAARERALAERRAARRSARGIRRRRNRGVALALFSLGLFLAIAGGAATVATSSHDRLARRFDTPRVAEMTTSESNGFDFSRSTERELGILPKGSGVLVLVSEPLDLQLAYEARAAAKALRDRGLVPVGATLDDSADRWSDGLSVQRETELMADATYAISPAQRGRRTVSDALERFVEREDEIDAVIYLQKSASNGYVRTSMAIACDDCSSSEWPEAQHATGSCSTRDARASSSSTCKARSNRRFRIAQ